MSETNGATADLLAPEQLIVPQGVSLQALFEKLCTTAEQIGVASAHYRTLRDLHAKLQEPESYIPASCTYAGCEVTLRLGAEDLPKISSALEEAGGSMWEKWLEAKETCDQACRFFESLSQAATVAAPTQ